METLTPNIFVKDIEATIAFYKQLGFELETQVPEEGTPVWVMMRCESVAMMFQTLASLADDLPSIPRQQGGAVLFYIQTSGIRALFDSLQGKVKVLKGLEKTFYGATEFSIEDNNGFVLTFAEDE